MTGATDPITLFIATRNLHKAEEIRAILGSKYRFLTLKDFADAPNVIENASTFTGNATKKAVELARWLAFAPSVKPVKSSNMFVLADDSGLEVDALNGSPGVHSARFAAMNCQTGNSADADNNAKLLQLLRDVPSEKRTGRFRCVIALTPVIEAPVQNASPVCYADEFEAQVELFEGVCEGRIGSAPRGKGGFGYDPLFVPEGFKETFGELSEETKNKLSHRANALIKLKQWLDAVTTC